MFDDHKTGFRIFLRNFSCFGMCKGAKSKSNNIKTAKQSKSIRSSMDLSWTKIRKTKETE